MSKQKHPLTRNQTATDLPLQNDLQDANPESPVQRQQQKEHLSRLFRQLEQSPDGLYLQGLMARYRGIDEP